MAINTEFSKLIEYFIFIFKKKLSYSIKEIRHTHIMQSTILWQSQDHEGLSV